jgi:hypothetical protein
MGTKKKVLRSYFALVGCRCHSGLHAPLCCCVLLVVCCLMFLFNAPFVLFCSVPFRSVEINRCFDTWHNHLWTLGIYGHHINLLKSRTVEHSSERNTSFSSFRKHKVMRAYGGMWKTTKNGYLTYSYMVYFTFTCTKYTRSIYRAIYTRRSRATMAFPFTNTRQPACSSR